MTKYEPKEGDELIFPKLERTILIDQVNKDVLAVRVTDGKCGLLSAEMRNRRDFLGLLEDYDGEYIVDRVINGGD